MQESLSRNDSQRAPLKEQEFYELRLDEIGVGVGVRFSVGQAHAPWSEVDGQIMWDDFQNDEFDRLEGARERYEFRRAALVQKGFIHSDLDF